MVAIPAYDGRVTVETVRALLNEHGAAFRLGLELQVVILPGCSLITHARNQLVQRFMESDCTRLVFVDSDIAWEPGELLKLASHPADVVGGAYRYKTAEVGYPVIWMDRPELWADPDTGLLEVRALPAGFLAISRAAFERLAAAHPDRAYDHHGIRFQGYFHAPCLNGELFGEDNAFCADWRAAGGQVWLDPDLNLTHVGGVNEYGGNIGKWLRKRAPTAVSVAA